MIYRDFIDAGYRIFPLWSFDEKGCHCGNSHCVGAGKHPRNAGWQSTPVWDDEQIEAMEKYGSLSSGYGVLCKGLLVIDVDARNGGIKSYKKLIKDFPEIVTAGLVVDTGSGGGSKHLYFKAPADIPLMSHLPEYPGIDMKATGYVVGPGSKHASGKIYMSSDGSPFEIDHAPSNLIAALRKPDKHRTEYNGISVDVSHNDIAEMLQYVPNADLHYDEWIKIGMAIHQATNGTGYEIWDTWSSTSAKYDDTVMQQRWHSFGRCVNPVTIGTIIFHAEQNGWVMPVTFIPDCEFSIPDVEDDQESGMPFDITMCDLKSPPGFVGDLAKWIESQSRRPRVIISVAAALTAMGNVAGLRYIDGHDRITSNMLTFCVAGSRTGKESCLQSVIAIHKEAGIAFAQHGAIKSEQEIVKNLTRHQASLYAIDEIGIFLQKIQNAQQRGGAIYLDGVIGMIMSAYSKADGYMLLTGDMKEEMRKMLTGELSGIERRKDEGVNLPYLDERIEQIKRQLDSLDEGLKNPFLSLIGFTTPVTFEKLVDYSSATNGFIGRALLFHERDTAPRSKPNFKKPNMPEPIAATIRQISTGGMYDSQKTSRIESVDERIEVPSDARAIKMLEDALNWLEDQAIVHKSKSGLESLYLGAYELVGKVSFILSVPEGIRTAEHVRWAFALVLRDVQDKIRLVMANDSEKESPIDSMQLRLATICGGEEGETIGAIRKKMRPRKIDEVDKVITGMVASGRLEETKIVNKFNKIETSRYRYIGKE